MLGRRPARPTLLLLDEAAQLGPMDEFKSAVTLMRGYGVQTWSFWQDLRQIQHLYPVDWKTIANNCKAVSNFNAGPGSMARVLADRRGVDFGMVRDIDGARWCCRCTATTRW